MRAETLKLGRHEVDVSSAGKVFFPKSKLTKGDLVQYYVDVARWMLPYLKDRPLSMQRFPDGIQGEGFFQKRAPDYFPEWIRTVEIEKSDGSFEMVVCDDAATLAYLANQAMVPHTWLSRTDKLDFPDQMILDLDPPGDGFEPARHAAFLVKGALESLGLATYVKTTGSRGLHVVVPLTRKDDFDAVRAFARQVADEIAFRYPRDFTTEHRLANRRGRLFIDVLRNGYGQTAVPAYCVRMREGAPVSAPITWEELADKKLNARTFTIQNILRRLESRKCPWCGMSRRAKSLAAARKKLPAWLKG